MKKQILKVKSVDGMEINLIPDVINLLGIGWDLFDKDHITFPDCIEMLREVQEVPNSNYNIRRFSLKLDKNWFIDDEDTERVFGASYFKDEEGQWVFRLDAYPAYYQDTPAERWINW